MKRVVLGAVVVLCLGTPACGDSAVETQYQRVVERTTPPHQTVPRDATLVRRDVALEATWDIQTDLNWEQYAEWVAQRLSGEYAATRIESRTMAFSKYVDGDRYAVTITATNNEVPLLLRLRFRATPD